jgi:hypothetical protein
MPNNKYAERLNMFFKTIEIGDTVVLSAKDLDEKSKSQYFYFSSKSKDIAANPPKGYETIKSLEFLETGYLNYWNETAGQHVETFWKTLMENNISYKRRNVFNDVFKRKKIKDVHEYHSVIDGFVIAQQEGRITADEALILSGYISDFEKKHRDKGK